MQSSHSNDRMALRGGTGITLHHCDNIERGQWLNLCDTGTEKTEEHRTAPRQAVSNGPIRAPYCVVTSSVWVSIVK